MGAPFASLLGIRLVEAKHLPPGVAIAWDNLRRRGWVWNLTAGTVHGPYPFDRSFVAELCLHPDDFRAMAAAAPAEEGL